MAACRLAATASASPSISSGPTVLIPATSTSPTPPSRATAAEPAAVGRDHRPGQRDPVEQLRDQRPGERVTRSRSITNPYLLNALAYLGRSVRPGHHRAGRHPA